MFDFLCQIRYISLILSKLKNNRKILRSSKNLKLYDIKITGNDREWQEMTGKHSIGQGMTGTYSLRPEMAGKHYTTENGRKWQGNTVWLNERLWFVWDGWVNRLESRAQYSCGIATFAISRDFLYFPQLLTFSATFPKFNEFHKFLQLSTSGSWDILRSQIGTFWHFVIVGPFLDCEVGRFEILGTFWDTWAIFRSWIGSFLDDAN